jgi:hypothetical protein
MMNVITAFHLELRSQILNLFRITKYFNDTFGISQKLVILFVHSGRIVIDKRYLGSSV